MFIFFTKKMVPIGANCIDNIKKSFGVLNPFLRILSLNCDMFLHTSYTVLSILRMILPALILGSLDGLSLYFKIVYAYKCVVVSIKYTDAVQVTFDFFQYIVDLYVIYKCGNSLDEYYAIYEKLDVTLGVKYCGSLMGRLKKIVLFYGFVWMISSACDCWAWLDTTGWQTAASFSISYIFVLIKIMTNLDMTMHLMHTEHRLRSIGDAAELICTKINRYRERDTKDSIRIISVGNMNIKEVKCLRKCYFWVLELSTFINNVFGTRVLLNTFSILIDIIRFANITARLLLGSQHLDGNSTSLFPVASTLMRMFTCVIIVVSLARHCELVYEQRIRIINIIDNALVFKEPSDDIKTVLNELRTLIQNRPVEFCMSNSVRIDYSLLGTMTSIVFTYSIILLQSVN